MKVNGVNIKEYGGKQLKVERQPPQIMGSYEWVDGAPIPQRTNEKIEASNLIVYMMFKGEERDEIVRNISLFTALFRGEAIIKLDGYKGYFKGYLKGSNVEKTIVKEIYKFKIDLDGYFFDDEKIEKIDENETYICVDGSRETPCTISLYAKNNTGKYEISGDFGDISIDVITKGDEIVINGETGIITKNGENAFETVDLWEFPVLHPGENKITVADVENVDVKITYRPMWL